MSSIVLDASALLAVLNQETRAKKWGAELPHAAMSTVNLSEVVAKLIDVGANEAEIRDGLDLGVNMVPFDAALAFETGLLRAKTRAAGLSLGDRACLALALRLGLPAVTTDRAWGKLRVEIDIVIMN